MVRAVAPKLAVALLKESATYTLVPLTTSAVAYLKSVPPARWAQAKLLVAPTSVSLATNTLVLPPLALVFVRVVAPKPDEILLKKPVTYTLVPLTASALTWS